MQVVLLIIVKFLVLALDFDGTIAQNVEAIRSRYEFVGSEAE